MSLIKSKKHLLSYIVCLSLIFSGIFIPAQPAEARTSLTKGIDVSAYNGIVDWEMVAGQGYTFAMIRIAEGQAPDVDTYFERNLDGAKAAGLKVGVYHDCCIRTPEDAALEAAYCLELLDGRELDYPIAYDMEKPGTFLGGKANTTEIAKAYCDAIIAGGYTPMIYSFASRLNSDFDWSQLEGIKIWVAHHGVDDANYTGPYDIWQYSSTGSVDGANTDKGVCDLNYSFMEAEGLSLSLTSATIGISESVTIAASLLPEGCTDSVTWKSSNKTIAKVSKTGKITGVAAGKATITATTGSGLSAKVTITVKKAPKFVAFSISKKTISKGKTYQTKITIPSGSASYKRTFTSSNKAIATISSNGLVTGKKAGTATITVKTFNNKTATIKIVVK